MEGKAMTDYIKREDVLRLIPKHVSPAMADELADAIAALPSAPVSEERKSVARQLEVLAGRFSDDNMADESVTCREASRLLRAPQQQAEPVAWQIKVAGVWANCPNEPEDEPGIEVRGLFAAPPPDDEAVRLLREVMAEGIEYATGSNYQLVQMSDALREAVRAYLSRKEPKG
jgi:hypothetical protein